MGFDDGAVMIKIGREEPVASMDASGKIIWARHNEIQTVNIKSLGSEFDEVSAAYCTLFRHQTGQSASIRRIWSCVFAAAFPITFFSMYRCVIM